MSEPKQIRFIDPQYNTLFTIPDGGSIVVTRPDSEIYHGFQEQWVSVCKYLDDTHVEINGRCWHICEFAEKQKEIGSIVMPEPEPEMIGGYRVTHRNFVRNLTFKLGHNPNAAEPYATWRCDNDDLSHNYWGHYWSDKSTADTDLFLRANAAREDIPYDHTILIKSKSSLKVLVVEPEEMPHQATIDNKTEAILKIVGGEGIVAIYPFDEPIALISGIEGKFDCFQHNRGLYDDNGKLHDIVMGTFVVCMVDADGNFASLSPDNMAKFSEKFHVPELFECIEDGKFQVFKKSVPPYKPSLKDTLAQNADRSKAEFPAQSTPKKSAELEL